ncbi:MAG TPA: RHS repeat-associated core domain-containing protein [Chlamydiales bacterium]|nr:RHS repeat-associated core domain-containing protein [Chlamydiales bacterium]
MKWFVPILMVFPIFLMSFDLPDYPVSDEMQVEIIEDELENQVSKNVYGVNGELLFCEIRNYDENHNLLKYQISYEVEDVTKKYQTEFVYDDQERIIQIIRGDENKQIRKYEYNDEGLLSKIVNPDQVFVEYEYNQANDLVSIKSSDDTVHYDYVYEAGNRVKIIDTVNNLELIQKYDDLKRLICEIYPDGNRVEKQYDRHGRKTLIDLKEFGKIAYIYSKEGIHHIIRTKKDNSIAYTHSYKKLLDGCYETLLNKDSSNVTRFNAEENKIKQQSDFVTVEYQFDEKNLLTSIQVDEEKQDYAHEECLQLISNDTYEPYYNLKKGEYSSLAELKGYNDIHLEYDLNGNLIKKEKNGEIFVFQYDALGRLTHCLRGDLIVKFVYDSMGRRLSKEIIVNSESRKEFYIYDEKLEIASFQDRKLQFLRIPGKTMNEDRIRAIAIEKEGQVYIPIHDLWGRVIKVIDSKTNKVLENYSVEPFGENLDQIQTALCPWIFYSKRYDAEIGLVYFGPYYFDPDIKRYISIDTDLLQRQVNPYIFDQNNPLPFFRICH